jgi:hypothetical protein
VNVGLALVNYFAHGMRFLDQPLFLAGTAVPDWMSVADRGVRVRPKLVEPITEEEGPDAETARGILQHFHDDDWFHRTPGFARVTASLTQQFREALAGDDGMRPGFLGNIVTEMLLDAVLIEQDPHGLDEYYAVLGGIDAAAVQEVVNRSSRRSTDRLVHFIRLFIAERFLYDYLESERLLYRLNQVLRRVTLQPLPETVIGVLDAGRELVREHVDALLPPARFEPDAAADFTGG